MWICVCVFFFLVCKYFTSNHIVTSFKFSTIHYIFLTEGASFQCSDKVQLTVLTKWPHFTVVTQSWIMSFCCNNLKICNVLENTHVLSSRCFVYGEVCTLCNFRFRNLVTLNMSLVAREQETELLEHPKKGSTQFIKRSTEWWSISEEIKHKQLLT
jgi:hypothetical protein